MRQRANTHRAAITQIIEEVHADMAELDGLIRDLQHFENEADAMLADLKQPAPALKRHGSPEPARRGKSLKLSGPARPVKQASKRRFSDTSWVSRKVGTGTRRRSGAARVSLGGHAVGT